ncbi:hypothetical protein [Streptomyces sp. NBC_01198]|uniref:hypothetical protein n=1 Tax=Streptomyces sp. NBC_01198 TaxID=2903769 RepID=UPI002E114070|nr:hypothetical protein OG702_32505 [Streptomyces sp. NBC_01198]
MPDVPYETAINEALERLEHAGFFLGAGGAGNQLRGFAIHAPMGAEALAVLGHGELVPDWVDGYAVRRGFGAPPDPFEPIDPADPASWQVALGETRRLADWATLFRHGIDEAGWHETLVTWWPRLTPGIMAGLTHGLIRTAHAVRSVAAVPEPSPLQLHEVANGLAFWAAMYQLPSSAMARGARAIGTVRTLGRRPADRLFADADALLEKSVDAALAELAAISAGRYLTVSGRVPVPAVHTVTAPAALRLVLPQLPAELAAPSYEAIREVCGTLLNLFAPGGPDDRPEPAVDGADPGVQQRVLDAAVELGDEHAIKISEAARREFADHPDPRCFAAAHHAVALLGGSPG